MSVQSGWDEYLKEYELTLDSDSEFSDPPRAWATANIDQGSAFDWAEAGCFDAETARESIDAGFSPSDVDGQSEECEWTGFYTRAYGYKMANGGMTLEQNVEAFMELTNKALFVREAISEKLREESKKSDHQ